MNLLGKLLLPIIIPLKFMQDNFKAILIVLIVFFLFAPNAKNELNKNNLLEISLIGPIMEVSEILEKIEKATTQNSIKGVLLVVDSPGGAVAPSVELAYAIKRLQKRKPVVIYAKGTIASGSYYASIWANEIIANPGSMVGSIGVIMQGADLSKLMETIGVKTQTIQAGKYKQVGTSSRKWKEYEVNELQKVTQGTYDMFTQDVANARKLDIAKRDIYANAHIFTAKQAKDVGLIDFIGVKYDAKEHLIALSKVDKAIWNKEDKFDKLIKKLSATTALTLHTYFPTLILK